MRKVVVFNLVSVDGYFAGSNPKAFDLIMLQYGYERLNKQTPTRNK